MRTSFVGKYGALCWEVWRDGERVRRRHQGQGGAVGPPVEASSGKQIEAGDHDGQVIAAWVAAQELRAIYRCRDRDQAAARLYDWTVTCIDSHVPELRRLARSGRDHRSTPCGRNGRTASN